MRNDGIELYQTSSEIIGYTCDDCKSGGNADEDGIVCEDCGSDNVLYEWNWEGVPCAFCRTTGQPDEDFGIFKMGNQKKEFVKVFTPEQIRRIEEYGGMCCLDCLDAISIATDPSFTHFDVQETIAAIQQIYYE